MDKKNQGGKQGCQITKIINARTTFCHFVTLFSSVGCTNDAILPQCVTDDYAIRFVNVVGKVMGQERAHPWSRTKLKFLPSCLPSFLDTERKHRIQLQRQ
jgi:hypothetical protein